MKTIKLKRQKTVRYKVVKKRTRYSCSLNGNSSYALQYEKKTEVHARPETIGVMCFKTYIDAEDFVQGHWWWRENCKIIAVIPMGKGHYEETVGPPRRLKEYYIGALTCYELTPPDGTICYPAVYVVD